MTQLPEDVHDTILTYLPFADILLSYQQTCAQWFRLATEKTKVVKLHDVYTSRTFTPSKEFIDVMNRRFPKMKQFHLATERQLDALVVIPNLKDCHDLETIHFSNGEVLMCNVASWKYELEKFPKYKATCVTYNGANLPLSNEIGYNRTHNQPSLNSKEVDQIASQHHVTHIGLHCNHYDEKLLRAATPYVVKTMTHITFKNVNKEVTDIVAAYLPSRTSLTHIESFVTFELLDFIRVSPDLESYSGVLTMETAKCLATHCPLLKNIEIGDYSEAALKHVVLSCKNLKRIKLVSFTHKISADLGVEEFEIENRGFSKQELSIRSCLQHLNGVKRMFVQLMDEEVDSFCKYYCCSRVEELSVNPLSFKTASFKKILAHCPKLRFITGVKLTVKAPRLGDAIDVIRVREEASLERFTKKPRK